jgi:hypothetical protein
MKEELDGGKRKKVGFTAKEMVMLHNNTASRNYFVFQAISIVCLSFFSFSSSFVLQVFSLLCNLFKHECPKGANYCACHHQKI